MRHERFIHPVYPRCAMPAGIVTVCDFVDAYITRGLKAESNLWKELLTFLTGSRASAMLLEYILEDVWVTIRLGQLLS